MFQPHPEERIVGRTVKGGMGERVARIKRLAGRGMILCLALLSGGFIIKAGLLRPSGTGEQWLRQQAERSSPVEVTLLDAGERQWTRVPLHQGKNLLQVAERAGIRDLLGAFETDGNFAPGAANQGTNDLARLMERNDGRLIRLANIRLAQEGGGEQWVTLYHLAHHWGLWRRGDNTCVPLRAACLPRVERMLRRASIKAQKRQPGYTLVATDTFGFVTL